MLDTSQTPAPQQNHLLAALPADAQERIFPYLQKISLPLGKVLYESGGTLRQVYFPTDATSRYSTGLNSKHFAASVMPS